MESVQSKEIKEMKRKKVTYGKIKFADEMSLAFCFYVLFGIRMHRRAGAWRPWYILPENLTKMCERCLI